MKIGFLMFLGFLLHANEIVACDNQWRGALLIPEQMEVPIYADSLRSHVIRYIMNDTITENFYELSVKDIFNGLFKVKAHPSLSDESGDCNELIEGWIDSEYVGIYLRSREIIDEYPMYIAPTKSAEHFNFSFPAYSCLVPIIDVHGLWVKTRIKMKGEWIIGWIPSEYLCDNPYSTCN